MASVMWPQDGLAVRRGLPVRPSRYCRHVVYWREPLELVDEVVVFASAWFDRPMTGRGVDMSWPDVGFYLERAGLPRSSSAHLGNRSVLLSYKDEGEFHTLSMARVGPSTK